MVYPETIQALGLTKFEDYPHPTRFEYKPQALRPCDVDIQIEACGVCGSDIHAATGNWGKPYTPFVVGHEIIGRVVKLGTEAGRGLKLGDRVGVGAQVDCDGTCVACESGLENHCDGQVDTYFGQTRVSKEGTMGGNASHIRVNSLFVFKIPDNLKTEHAAPLLCGGITGFGPLIQHKIKAGDKVGVVGIGGIGHMTVLFAKALGCEVTAISRGDSKRADAAKLGADHYIATAKLSPEELAKHACSLDIIVNTGSSFTGTVLETLFTLLKPRGKFVFITAPPATEQLSLIPIELIKKGFSVQGSHVGSVAEIEYMLDFASKHNIKPWVETIDINEESLGRAWERAQAGDVHYRFTMTGYDKFFKNA